MKYNLVALFDKNSNELINLVQRDLCRKYRVYKLKTDFYIKIQTINDSNIEEFSKIISKSLYPYKKFKIQINSELFLDDHFKHIGLKVDKSGYIKKISRNLSDTLYQHGYNISNQKNNFGIHIVSSNYQARKMFRDKSNCSIPNKTDSPYLGFAKINRLELRKPVNNKKEILIKSFPLRDY
ncbi:2'-5' RNA ligase family protein [Clostridium sediminicola]|uniref:2'-5' RNA ligase n=1 Tax=Clostridium sediminicola TaxID=3114879 RepID=UPI0031F22EE8